MPPQSWYSRVQVSAQNQDVVGFPVDRDDSGTVNNVDTIAALTAAIGLASASAFVTDGVLGAKASAGSLSVGGIQGQTATGNALFVDTLTLISSSLSAGTTVTRGRSSVSLQRLAARRTHSLVAARLMGP